MSSESGEHQFLRWLRRKLPSPDLLGDDAAILPSAGERAVTVDSQIEGVHFPSGTSPAMVARRLLAVNLSDLAAMGAEPGHALLALAAPEGFDHRAFFEAFLAASLRYGVQLAGGDLARHPAGLTATLTLFGDLPDGHRWLRRSGASPGEALWTGGSLGESAAGRILLAKGAELKNGRVRLPEELEQTSVAPAVRQAARRAVRRHLLPEPQLELGLALSKLDSAARATMDLSDGLAADLPRLCAESGVGAEIDLDLLPIAADFGELCAALGTDPLDLTLGGGEDYALLFTLPAGAVPPDAEGSECRRIGRVLPEREIRWLRGDVPAAITIRGWDHLRAGRHKGAK